MKLSALERNSLVCLAAVLAAAIPVFFTGCGAGMIAPSNGSRPGSKLAVNSVVPNSGPLTGGTTVTINGSNLSSATQNIPPTVTFGGVAASQVTIISPLQVRARVPAHAAGSVSVEVTTADGESSALPTGFTYTSGSLTVSSVSPNSGPTAGGTTVTVNGSNFASGAAVSFGGSAAASVSFVSSSQLRATTPAHAAGAVAVQVTNSDGTSGSLPNGFTYAATSSPTISSLSPSSGPTSGGTAVTVNGSNFASGATVSFGGAPASGVSFVSSTQLKATTPAHATGAVTVQVTNSDGTSANLPNGFTYGSTTLSVSSVSPVSGPADGGTTVTISGSNFQSGVSVTIGGLAASSVTLSNSTTIQATTPPHSSGTVSVTVTNPDGQSATASSGYTFHSVDLAWSAPSSSPVTITGYNVYRALSSGGPFGKLNGTTPITTTSYSDGSVAGATTYFYEVKSVDSSGTESAPEGPAQATVSP